MSTWEYSDIFANLEILSADGASELFVLIPLWAVNSLRTPGGSGCPVLIDSSRGRRHTLGVPLVTQHRRRALRRSIPSVCCVVLQLNFGIWFRGCLVSELDDGNRIQHCSGQTLGPTLSRSTTERATGSVSLRMTMCPNGTRRNNDQEQKRDQPSDTIQYAHSNC